MSDHITRNIIDEIAASLDIPESAYEKAEKRYKDLGDWFGRPEAKCAAFSPHIYAQGSFRLGTVNRPLYGRMEYDLDLGCRLRSGITKTTHTQKQLKTLVGADLEEYRKARQIQDKLEEKHRCWRLPYQDELSFHIDSVPSIPEDESIRSAIKASMIREGSLDILAQRVASHTGAITDNRSRNYDAISDDWRISNSEGYALWFESRMKLARQLMEDRAIAARAAKVDDLPARQWKSPLQRAIQILKRHRDVMFSKHPDGAPISIIIATLAAAAYQGEPDVASALERILADMRGCVRPTIPRVPNPVNPAEDFADKWHDPAYRHLQLEENFWLWLEQAQADFRVVAEARDATYLAEAVKAKFASSLDLDRLSAKLDLGANHVVTRPKSHDIEQAPARPWMSI